MNITEKWFELYESLYGTNFNRILTIGTPEEGYENYPITSLDNLKEYCEEKSLKNELYISFYDYDSDELSIKWNPLDDTNFEKYSIKNCILFRFRIDTNVIQEETEELSDVQKFMFIRRTLNLGGNKTLIKDTKNVYDTIKKMFNIEPWVLFNGYDECYLYIFTNELKLKAPTLTLYYFYKFIEKYTDTTTMSYSKVNPFSQLVALPGSQNRYTRLYVKPYDINLDYLEVIKNSENKNLEDSDFMKEQDTSSIEEALEKVDNEICKVKDEENMFNLVDLFEYYL